MLSRSWWLVLPLLAVGCGADAESQRYRGGYTFGHEVNSFCPEINSQCYWLGPDTSTAVRDQLRTLYESKKPGLYEPVCVVIEAVIDRDSARDGFAADYDGLITILAIEGDCDSSAAITPGDLNHRRWVLTTIDGRGLDAADAPVVLDFGERLYLSGLDGCQRFSGFADIEGNEISLDQITYDSSGCTSGDLSLAKLSQTASWQVSLVEQGGLLLENGNSQLVFKRDDWR